MISFAVPGTLSALILAIYMVVSEGQVTRELRQTANGGENLHILDNERSGTRWWRRLVQTSYATPVHYHSDIGWWYVARRAVVLYA